MNPRNSYMGTVYLLHFDRPYKHARHYTGWTLHLEERLAEHAAGHGARLLAVVREAGINWTLARTWKGTRHRERRIKNQGGASRFCPMCGITPQPERPLHGRRDQQVIWSGVELNWNTPAANVDLDEIYANLPF